MNRSDKELFFQARRSDGTRLPLWLLFDKIGGVFWGVPLTDDISTLHLVIRKRNISEEVTINVIETSDLKDKCPSTEDNTVLSLLIDKGVRAIKPKQRVISVNNIAKFFGLSNVYLKQNFVNEILIFFL